ncbi:cardiolipin synthase [Lysobacter sp. Root916]|uniref:phospholipase D family protein n=1 Tax=Lysobacter sp. Root916 TaxID=1736606 RepID=UPI00070B3359|nr:phospholipase D family protein [Lysobacter sp. Root916]KRD31915.1 cardiolipin synthase [Lysobacter sp. Root916]
MRIRISWRWFAWGLLALLALVVSGVLLADRLTPPATGAPSAHLPLRAAQTTIDRELAPRLAAHPGKTGVLMIPGGLEAFAARATSARASGRSLDLQYYMWHDDLVGGLLGRELYAAAERGVRVRLLLDDINAKGLDPALMVLDAHRNIEIRLYNPFRNREGLWRLLEMVQRVFSINHRMHNKAWIADGRVAVVGGRNVGDEYFDAHQEVNFRDLDLLLAGPAVADASAIFDRYWNSPAVVPIAALSDKKPAELKAYIARIDDDAKGDEAKRYLQRVSDSLDQNLPWDTGMHWSEGVRVVSDPAQKRGDGGDDWLVTQLIAKLATTQREALLISPYFVPGEEGSEGLVGLVRKGAQVGVVTNSLAANDVPAVHSGYARYRERLLAGGVRLYEIRRSGPSAAAGLFGSSGASLHTKAFVVDGARGFVGSFNLDPRSAELNTEMGVLFEDATLAASLRREYERLAAPALSYRVTLDDGRLCWLDETSRPPRLLDREPDAGLMRRATARVLGWLPIESQL